MSSDRKLRRRRARWAVVLWIAMALVVSPACGTDDSGGEAADAERYELTGEIVAADPERMTVTVAHDEIPGFMSAMTMPFNVRDDWVFQAAEPGADIAATLVVSGTASWLEDVVVVRSPTAGAAAEAVVETADPGEPVPDVPLVNQDGEEIGLQDFRGGYLVFTFIYTRCPLPDFCPRMSAFFAELHEAVVTRPDRYGDARLLSVTIDPEYDTPAVLREYAGRYLDLEAADPFDRWQFARAEPEELARLADFVGLRYQPSDDEVVHNLRTAIVDPRGRLVEVVVGNTWDPVEILSTLEAAAAS